MKNRISFNLSKIWLFTADGLFKIVILIKTKGGFFFSNSINRGIVSTNLTNKEKSPPPATNFSKSPQHTLIVSKLTYENQRIVRQQMVRTCISLTVFSLSIFSTFYFGKMSEAPHIS